MRILAFEREIAASWGTAPFPRAPANKSTTFQASRALTPPPPTSVDAYPVCTLHTVRSIRTQFTFERMRAPHMQKNRVQLVQPARLQDRVQPIQLQRFHGRVRTLPTFPGVHNRTSCANTQLLPDPEGVFRLSYLN